jgi:hypothetical protein
MPHPHPLAGNDEVEISGKVFEDGSTASYPECRRYTGLKQDTERPS